MSQYVRGGRGGAGNFVPKEQVKPLEVEMKSKRSIDLEAANPSDPADASSVHNIQPSQQQPQYKTQGRGGAGNWYEPATLKQTGTFSNPTDPEGSDKAGDDANASTAPTQSARVWRGRGGAGNWEADQAIKEDLKRKSLLPTTEDRKLTEAIKEEARKDADSAIKVPESAHVHVPHLDRHKNAGDETHDI